MTEPSQQESKKRDSTSSIRSNRNDGISPSGGNVSIPPLVDPAGSNSISQPYFHRTCPNDDSPTPVALPPILPRKADGTEVSKSKFIYSCKRMDKGNLVVPSIANIHKVFREKTPELPSAITTSRDEADDVFVTVEKLNSRDIFGMNTVSFSEDDLQDSDIPEVALVSKGAEIVMLSKKMFLKHADERVKLCVQELVAPYPKDAQLQENLQIKADWHVYRDQVLRDVMFTNYALKNCMSCVV